MAKINYAKLYTLRADGRYQGYWRDEKGNRHTVCDRDPEKLYNKIKEKESPKPITFKELAEAWQNKHWERVGYKTAEAYTAPLRRIVSRYGDDLPSDVNAATIQAYLNELGKQGYSRRSVQMHRDIFNMIFNEGIVSGIVDANPCVAVSMPRNLGSTQRELPNDAAIEAVKAGVDKPFGLFALVCLYAGLRRGEALALRHEDIDRENGVIHVTKAVEYIGNNPHLKSPKTEAGRRDVVLLDVLAKQIPKGKGFLFHRDDGGLLTKVQYRKRWLAYCDAIGFDITAHQLRHGFATILFEAGVADKDAQELLGHSSIAVTRDIYTHIRQTRRTETAKKINDFLGA